MLKTAELVALEIVRDISGQGLKPGDRLPLESEMLTQYKVSRSSLREALRLLEAQGLINIRTGPRGGTTVGRPSPFYLARTATPYLHLAGATYGQALEAWAQTEQLLARAAALNPDRAHVQAAMARFLPGGSEPREWGVNEGMGFHDTIAMLTDNPVLDLMLQAVAHIVSDYILNVGSAATLESWMVDDHEALAQAIVDGDAARAQQLMEDHARHVIDLLERFAPQRIGERIAWA